MKLFAVIALVAGLSAGTFYSLRPAKKARGVQAACCIPPPCPPSCPPDLGK